MEPEKMPTIADLYRSRDAVVHAVLAEWQHGGFTCFEQALIYLSVILLRQRNEAQAKLLQMYQESPPPIVIRKDEPCPTTSKPPSHS